MIFLTPLGRKCLMPRQGLNTEAVIKMAAILAEENGYENLTLHKLADKLNIKPASLYTHIKGLDDLKKQLMIFGWKQMQDQITLAVTGLRGYDALKAMCYAFYNYATENPGVFNVMLWYNKFQDHEMETATSDLLSIVFEVAAALNLPEEYGYHLIRTFRSFLEGFSLLVNNGSFGHPLPIKDSFELSLNILIDGIKISADKFTEPPYSRT